MGCVFLIYFFNRFSCAFLSHEHKGQSGNCSHHDVEYSERHFYRLHVWREAVWAGGESSWCKGHASATTENQLKTWHSHDSVKFLRDVKHSEMTETHLFLQRREHPAGVSQRWFQRGHAGSKHQWKRGKKWWDNRLHNSHITQQEGDRFCCYSFRVCWRPAPPCFTHVCPEMCWYFPADSSRLDVCVSAGLKVHLSTWISPPGTRTFKSSQVKSFLSETRSPRRNRLVMLADCVDSVLCCDCKHHVYF